MLNKIKNRKNIVDSVLEEMNFSEKEESLFKDVIQTIKKNKDTGNKNTSSAVMEEIEVGIKDDI